MDNKDIRCVTSLQRQHNICVSEPIKRETASGKMSAEIAEQCHQRYMMLRAAQATGGAVYRQKGNFL